MLVIAGILQAILRTATKSVKNRKLTIVNRRNAAELFQYLFRLRSLDECEPSRHFGYTFVDAEFIEIGAQHLLGT
jgi:hypothetical protein